MSQTAVFGVCVLFALGSSVACAGDAARGQNLYETRCGGCHSIETNRVGPAHQGVFGRKAGAARDYDYSNALRSSKVVWNERTLSEWLADPEKTIPGQRMGYSVREPGDRADLIAYLKKESGK